MRTLPANFSTGLSSSLVMFHLLKVVGRNAAGSAVTYYWPTKSKNLTGVAMTLKATSGGSALTYDATMIAKELRDGRSSRLVEGLGETEQSIDTSLGGNVSRIGDLDVTLLNLNYSGSTRFDEALESGGIHLENATVTLMLGFIPAGATPTVVIADDMITLWTGIVEGSNEYDHPTHRLRCVDATHLREKTIPEEMVDVETYPRAPKENINRPIPLLYGDHTFETLGGSDVNDEQVWHGLNDLCPAPGLQVDTFKSRYIFASHHCAKFTNSIFQYAGSSDIFGLLYEPPADNQFVRTNTEAAGCFADLNDGGFWVTIIAQWMLPGAFRQSRTTAAIAEADFAKVIDRDPTTSHLLIAGHFLAVGMRNPSIPGMFCSIYGNDGINSPIEQTIFLRAFHKTTLPGNAYLRWTDLAGTTTYSAELIILNPSSTTITWATSVLQSGGSNPAMSPGVLIERQFEIENLNADATFVFGLAVGFYTKIYDFKGTIRVSIPRLGGGTRG